MVGLNTLTLKTAETEPKSKAPQTLLELQRRNLENLMKRNTKKNKVNKTQINGMYFDLDR